MTKQVFSKTIQDNNGLRVPDFFVVGAPKCGTTAINKFLSQHPDIFISARKELHYFGGDLDWRNYSMSKEEYFSYFCEVDSKQIAGETSVFYLFSKDAADEIKTWNPNSRIIAIIRDPMEMIPSLHRQFLKTGNEFILDLEEALDAEPERKKGNKLPRKENMGLNQGLFYSEMARYSEQLERYFQVFGRDRVHVILYEDFKKNPASVYRGILEFLGVDPTFQPEFSYINTKVQIKSPWLWKFVKFPPEYLRQIWRTIIPSKLRGQILVKVSQLYSKKAPRKTLPEPTRLRLHEMYRDDVKQLEEILGRDLSSWLGGIKK